MPDAEVVLRILARELFEESVQGAVLELARAQDRQDVRARHTGTGMLADAEDTGKLDEQIQDTKDRMGDMTSGRHPAAPLWRQHANEGGGQATEHMTAAQEKLREGNLADAYQHLHEAHRLGVEQVLPRAHDKATEDNARGHLDRIQQHMERIDKVAGTSPEMTRRVLGSSGEQNQRAKDVKDRARHGALDAAEAVNHQGVADHEATGLLSDEDRQSVRKTLQQRQDERDARAAAAGMTMPPPLKGAAAVHPQLGHRHVTLPGSTMSGHEMANRAMPVPQEPSSPAVGELKQASQHIERLNRQAGQRRKQDLRDHLQAMRSLAAERRGQPAEGEYAPLSDQELSTRAGDSEAAVEQALRGGQSTAQQHTLDGNGQVWTPERAALHAEIIRDFLDKQTDVPSRREALLLGGPAGTDRRRALEGQYDPSQYAHLSAGDFQDELARRGAAPTMAGMSPGESSPLTHEEGQHLAHMAGEELARHGKNVAWDATMKDHDTAASRVRHLKSQGYQVGGLLADASPDEAGSQASSRYRHGVEAYRQGIESSGGGRNVPRHVVLDSEAEPGVSHSRQTMDRLAPELSQPGQGVSSVEDLRRELGLNEQ